MLTAILLAAGNIQAQKGEVEVTSASLNRNGELMSSSLTLNFDDLNVKSNDATVFVPMIVNGADTLTLDGVGLYGRTRWYQFERFGNNPLSGAGEKALRFHKGIRPVTLTQNVAYAEWMNGSQLMLKRTDYGCAGCLNPKETLDDLAAYREIIYKPVFIFEEAVAERVKTHELTGRAFVDFPVNKIVIYPDYRNNSYELGKIIATIDSVKNDPDITVTSIFIKGTASPEGPYDNNVYLAKNRTIALKEYVTNLYNFPKDFIQTDYNPVDWPGLREWLESNSIEHKAEILSIVNSDLESYARNSKIKKDFPKEYDWLLKNVYPSLRHSDYRIEYIIRQFTDVREIAEILRTAPQKLSLNEIYLLAGTYEPGSPEYNEVFETAVRLFPNDEIANLNAANAAMQTGNLAKADQYLQKAGGSAKAIYARGVLAALSGDFNTAVSLVEQAIGMGLEDNFGILEHMKELSKYSNQGL